ncbi:hypothetical protein CEXT_688701, partial [Caerostris extrusa]
MEFFFLFFFSLPIGLTFFLLALHPATFNGAGDVKCHPLVHDAAPLFSVSIPRVYVCVCASACPPFIHAGEADKNENKCASPSVIYFAKMNCGVLSMRLCTAGFWAIDLRQLLRYAIVDGESKRTLHDPFQCIKTSKSVWQTSSGISEKQKKESRNNSFPKPFSILPTIPTAGSKFSMAVPMVVSFDSTQIQSCSPKWNSFLFFSFGLTFFLWLFNLQLVVRRCEIPPAIR